MTGAEILSIAMALCVSGFVVGLSAVSLIKTLRQEAIDHDSCSLDGDQINFVYRSSPSGGD